MARTPKLGRDAIALLLHDIYQGPAWHGPSVLATLRGIDHRAALRRQGRGRNTIWELVLHLAYARYRLLLRLGLSDTGRFPRPLRADWWPRLPDPATAEQWRLDLALLADYQEQLLAAAASVSPALLRVRRSGQPRPLAWELLGVAFHDAYHAGQIRLLDRLGSRGK